MFLLPGYLLRFQRFPVFFHKVALNFIVDNHFGLDSACNAIISLSWSISFFISSRYCLKALMDCQTNLYAKRPAQQRHSPSEKAIQRYEKRSQRLRLTPSNNYFFGVFEKVFCMDETEISWILSNPKSKDLVKKNSSLQVFAIVSGLTSRQFHFLDISR